MIANTYVNASGRKNEPESPSRKKTGRKTSTTIRLANTTADRTSSEAFKTTQNGGQLDAPGSARLRRNRRTIFSTSMIASSTTSPMAMTRPASTIVLIVNPA